MIRYSRGIFFLFLAAIPLHLQAVDEPTQIPQTSQSVEEPDAPDDADSMGMPPDEPSPAIASQVSEPSVKAKPPTAEDAGGANYEQVVLQGLNKVTARAQTIEAPIGSVVRSGTIEIVAHSCWKAAPDERPENAALLEISEIKQGEAPRQIFLGWMFSSSPGLSALEHPFYDITVVKCEKAADEEPAKPTPPTVASKKASKKSP